MITYEDIETVTRLNLLSFYGWWQFGACLFAFVGLLAIWYHIGRKQKDFGQVWLAISVLCWSLSGLVEVFYSTMELDMWNELIYEATASSASNQVIELGKLQILDFQTAQSAKWTGWTSIFSLFNSLFILLALPWFRYIPKSINAIVKSKFWKLIVGLPFLFSLLPTLSKIWNYQANAIISELDVYYSVFTLIFLGIIMWSSFDKRRLPVLAWISLLSILITFIAQIYKMTGSDINLILFSAIFKTSLIMIFFALALSWVKELSENTITNLEKISLKLFQNQTNGLTDQGVYLFMGSKKIQVNLGDSYFALLGTFVQKKKHPVDEGWLEIKPKNDHRSGKTYEIQDHNQIKRLLQQMLNTMYGKSNWSNDIQGIALRNKLFEKSTKHPRLIRLSDEIDLLD